MNVSGNRQLLDSSLLTPLEVAAVLNISLGTLAGWRHSRKGPKYVKLGRLVRYRRADIADFIGTETRGGQHA